MTSLTAALSRSGTTTLKVSEVLAERPTISELRVEALDAIGRGDYGRAVVLEQVVYRRLEESRASEGISA